MIVDPINDVECLGQLTVIVRELAPTTLVRTVARHLGSRQSVVDWLRQKPQADDDGREPVLFISCDVPQRVRLFADDPNCVERATDAAMLLEALEQLGTTAPSRRALATVDHPLRHTGLVEKSGDRWWAVDLFPRRDVRRNVSLDQIASGLQGVHRVIGKPILQFYLGQSTGGKVADAIGGGENMLLGKIVKPTPAPEKQSSPSASAAAGAQLGQPGATSASKQSGTTQKGGIDGGQTQARQSEDQRAPGGQGATNARASASGAEARGSAEAGSRGDYDPHNAGEKPQRGGDDDREWWGV